MTEIYCANCGKPIKGGQAVVKVEYGNLGLTAHPHAKVTKKEGSADWFHRECDMAIRRPSSSPQGVG